MKIRLPAASREGWGSKPPGRQVHVLAIRRVSRVHALTFFAFRFLGLTAL